MVHTYAIADPTLKKRKTTPVLGCLACCMTRFHMPRAWPLHSRLKKQPQWPAPYLAPSATQPLVKPSKKSTSIITKSAKKAKGMQIFSSIQWAYSSTIYIPCWKQTLLSHCFHHTFSDASWLKAVTEAKTNMPVKFIHLLAWIKSHQPAPSS